MILTFTSKLSVVFATRLVTTDHALNVGVVVLALVARVPVAAQSLMISQMRVWWQRPQPRTKVTTVPVTRQSGQRLTDRRNGVRSGRHHVGVPPDGAGGRRHQCHRVEQNFGCFFAKLVRTVIIDLP